ncbi:MAG: DUF6484 domain-containing protein [Aquabacterium sp.]
MKALNMDPQDLPAPGLSLEAAAADAVSVLSPLLDGRAAASLSQPAAAPAQVHGVVVGTLLAVTDNGLTPLVAYPGQPGTAAIPARSTVDLCGPHIGRDVVLMFEGGDPCRPIVMGVMQGATGWPLAEQPATVDVDADGQRMIVSASEELVLRCGKASITLTKAGKVLIDGTYVSSRSSGVNRVKGGSVQLN